MLLRQEASAEKLRGAYYTPLNLAQFIIKWGFSDNVTTVLEPSCGDGVFLECLKNTLGNYDCVAVELNEEEAEKARRIVQGDTRFNVITNDFYNEYENHLRYRNFDFIVGNPPYIRYQYLTEEQREEQSKILTINGLVPNKLINAWVSFVVACVQMLSGSGKIGFVIPAELLQVKYAEQLRMYLMNHLQRITIVTFRELVFPGVEQEVVLLLGEKDVNHHDEHQIKILEFINIEDLITNFETVNENIHFQNIDMTTAKWTRYFLSKEQNEAINEIKRDNRFIPFGAIGEVDIGITTGNNKFFCVDKETVNNYDLGNVAIPLIARSVNIPGVTFNHEDWMQNVESGAKAYLLDFNNVQENELTAPQLRYIAEGEAKGENTGYKCRIRNRWYCIPSIWSPDAFFLRRNHLYPKFVLNNIGAVSTDTMHRIRFSMLTDRRRAILAYYNSIALAFTELEARSYGGGVLEILPGELERVTIPNLEDVELENDFVDELFNEVDLLVRNSNDIVEVLDLVDQKILIEVLNIPSETVNIFRSIWLTLRDRRLGRN
jgi:adenine-specific DNA-methyltransferase